MSQFLNYGRQSISDDDIQAVVSVLKSDFLTQGPAVQQFENAICDYTGAKYCIAVSNATAGLHLAIAALQVEKGFTGITTPNTFLATSNSLLYNQLKPQFADIDNTTYNIDPDKIRSKINKSTKLLIPVHFAGRVAEMLEISSIAKNHDLFVIEDAAHAIGSNYPSGEKVGSCVYSDLTVFSFHPVKTMTTGEGGAITTNNKALFDRLLMLRSHGVTKNPELLETNPGRWYYEMHDLGFNYRLTDIQAALGYSQLQRIESFKKKRLEIIDQYHSFLEGVSGLSLPSRVDEKNNCYHLFTVQIDFDSFSFSRDELMGILREEGVGTQVHYIPVHLQPYYKKNFNYKEGDYPIAEKFYNRALSLPLYPDLTIEEVSYISNHLKRLLI